MSKFRALLGSLAAMGVLAALAAGGFAYVSPAAASSRTVHAETVTSACLACVLGDN